MSSTDERREAVAYHMHAEGWHGPWVKTLAKRHKVTVRTIQTDRYWVLDNLDSSEFANRESRRSRVLWELDCDIQKARNENNWNCVASMHGLRAKLLGLDRVPPPEPEPVESEMLPDDPLMSQLQQIRSMRRDAQLRGSMVASAKFFEMETAIIERLRDEAKSEEELKKLSQNEDELLARFTAALKRLPPQLRARILAMSTDG